MAINQIQQTAATPPVTTVPPKQEQMPKPNTATNTTVKKDTVILSEAAKDLAAFQAGKSAQEEANETITSKLKEEASKPQQ